MSTIKFTIGKEYQLQLSYSEIDYAFMEKDRQTHISDWDPKHDAPDQYKAYKDRLDINFVNASDWLTTIINDEYSAYLQEFIGQVCSMTASRPFEEAFFDVKLYPDPERIDRFNIFMFIIVRGFKEDSLDTLSRSHIAGLFENEHHDEIVTAFAQSKGTANFHENYLLEKFNSIMHLIYPALGMEYGKTFYHQFFVDVEAVPNEYYDQITPLKGPQKAASLSTINNAIGEVRADPIIGPIMSVDELRVPENQDKVFEMVRNLVHHYRLAFGLGPLPSTIDGSDLLIKFFEHDLGMFTLFCRKTRIYITSTLSGTSTWVTFDDFVEGLMEDLELTHEFENVFDDEDFDPKLMIGVNQDTLTNDLMETVTFFCTDFRENEETFVDKFDNWMSFEYLSPWYIIKSKLRSSEAIIKLLSNQEIPMLDETYPFVTPEMKATYFNQTNAEN